MSKKGDINWFLIMMVAGIVALIVIVVIFQQMSSRSVKSYQDIQGQADVKSLSQCNNFILGRSCQSGNNGNCPEGMKKAIGNLQCDQNMSCCERA